MKKYIAIGVTILVLFTGFSWITGKYNGLINYKTKVESSWAQVENNYQSRFDLLPNLQAIVQGAANFEQETLTAVTAARTQWQSATTREEQVAAGNQFDSAFSRLLVTVEAYPNLTATQGYLTFQAQLEGIENRIRVARMDYNNVVENYNIYVQTFPQNFVANVFGFEKEPFFKGSAGSESAPKLDFAK